MKKELKKILHIELDETPEVDYFVHEIKELSVREQIVRTSEFIKSKLKNAISPDSRTLPSAEQAKIARVLRQDEGIRLSEVLQLGYGVCVEFHALGKLVFDKLGIPCEFKTGSIGRGPDHTYLDIEVDSEWEIFDPFAEVYLRDIGHPESKLFHEGYYRSSNSR